MKEPKYKKTQMGRALDVRKAMGAVTASATEWCKAFDAGDMEALAQLSQIFGEVLEDFTVATTEMSEAET